MRRIGFLVATVALLSLLGFAAHPESAHAGDFTYKRSSAPARTIVTDSATGKWLATFTDGAYTVSLAGPSRTFSEQTASYSVKSSIWVRTLPKPFNSQVDEGWLKQALVDTSPDVLELATQYIENAPSLYDGSGLKVAGDAAYGPLQADGTRQEGSDFNDYLGVPWSYADGNTDQPEAAQVNSLDCSGFVRMIFGYRSKLPLTLSPNGTAIPRRSYQILDSAPGVVTIPNAGKQITSFGKLSTSNV